MITWSLDRLNRCLWMRMYRQNVLTANFDWKSANEGVKRVTRTETFNFFYVITAFPRHLIVLKITLIEKKTDRRIALKHFRKEISGKQCKQSAEIRVDFLTCGSSTWASKKSCECIFRTLEMTVLLRTKTYLSRVLFSKISRAHTFTNLYIIR